MKKLYLKTFGWSLPALSGVEGFRDCETSLPKDGPAGFVAGSRGDHGFSVVGEGVVGGIRTWKLE